MSRAKRTLGEIAHAMKIAVGIGAVLAFLLLSVAVMAYGGPTHTFSDDHYTVANSTDGEDVIVTFEVQFEKHGEMDTADRKAAMDNMNLAQSCANEKLDAYIESHTAEETRNADLREVVVGCGNEYISIERIDTARGVPA